MRPRALGIAAIVFAFVLLIVPAASGWTQLAPITPDAPNAMVYTKGLALDPRSGSDSGIWVTDVGKGPGLDRAYKYPLVPAGSSTAPLQSIGGSFSGGGTMSYPGGIAVNPANGAVYIADTTGSLIRSFTAAGMLTTYTTGNSGAVVPLDRPHGLKIAGGTLYIANSGSNGIHRGIKRVSLDFGSWGSDITSADFHTGPSDVAVDTAGGRIWAADEGDRAGEDDGAEDGSIGSVLRFNTAGAQQQRLTNAEFDQPYSVEYDAAANVLYMGDYAKNLVFVLNADNGEILDRIGATGPAPLNTPVSMSFDPASRILYVGQVGTKTWGGPGAREIKRFQSGAVPSCAATQNVSTAFQTAVAVNLTCDGGSETLRYEITANPTKGSFGAPSNGGATRTYTPGAGYAGNDQFAFRVVTKRGISPTKTVTIAVGAAPQPTGPTGPTSPGGPADPVIPPADPAPVVAAAIEFVRARFAVTTKLRGVHIVKRGGGMIELMGTISMTAKSRPALPSEACREMIEIVLLSKSGRRARALNSDFAKLRSRSGRCAGKFSISTAAQNRKKKLSVRLTHPGNDSILPIDARFPVN